MSYLNSSDVTVFPSTRRSSTHVTARLMSEQSVVNIVNKLIDEDGFIITTNFSVSSPFEFNIHGYYFKIATGQDIIDAMDSAEDIYASITIDTTTAELPELSGQDDPDTDQYTGLSLSSTATVGTNIYSLHILHKDSGTWEVYKPSIYKFAFQSINMTRDIDGGVI